MNDARPGEQDDFLPITYSIVGVQKAATSTLHSILVGHRQVARPPKKELHFFDDEKRSWSPPDFTDYRVARSAPWQTIAGDATPIYLYWPHALERMRAYRPAMRLIACFRDPIDRAFSHWTMQAGRLDGYPSFPEVVERWTAGATPTSLPTGGSALKLRTHSLVDRGFYGAQLRRGLDLFPREQWLLLDFHRVVKDQDAVAGQLSAFLGLPPFRRTPEPRRRHPSAATLSGAPLTADLVARLAATYAEDLAELGRLSGLDVSDWPTSRIVAGDLDPQTLADDLSRRAGLA